MKLEFKKSLDEILKKDNVAELLDKEQLNRVGMLIQETYKADLQSCEEEFEIMDKGMDLAMQKITKRTDGIPNTNIPLVWMAVQRFSADAYPALVRDENIVKAKVIGNDEAVYMKDPDGKNDAIKPETGERIEITKGGEKLSKGERIAEFENYILTERSPDFIETIDKSLSPLGILGTIFKKTYFDPYIKRTVSRLFYPKDIVVNNNATNMEEYPVSQIIEMTQNEIKQRMVSGEYLEYEMKELIEYKKPDENADDKDKDAIFAEHDQLVSVIEQHRVLDLDGDGYKEPYVVTISLVNEKVLKINKRFTNKSILRNKKKGNKILEIKGHNFFTPYIFIPNPKGTFYGIGYGYLLHKMNRTVNGTVNQLMQAGINSNLTRGFISSDLRPKGGDWSIKQNEWKILNTPGIAIKEGIVPLDSKEPSVTLYNLMVFLIDISKQIASITDVLEGNIPSNMQPTTIMAMVEQGMKEFKSIYKRIRKSMGQEVAKIHNIIASDPEGIYSALYSKVLDYPEEEMNFAEDYKEGEFDIVLTADTEVITNMEKISKAMFLMQFLTIPNLPIKQYELMKRILGAVRIEDLDDLLVKPQPQKPDPMAQALQQQVQNEAVKAQTGMIQAQERQRENSIKAVSAGVEAVLKKAQVGKIKAETMKTLAEAEAVEPGQQLEEYKAQTDKLIKEQEIEIKKKDNINKAKVKTNDK
jgi:chaperonin GroES